MSKYWVIALCLWAGCASAQKPSKIPFDYAKIKSISVVPFNGTGGKDATDAVVRALVGTGVDVRDANHAGDVILSGSMTDYKPTNQSMVFLGQTPVMSAGGQMVQVVDPVIYTGGAQVLPETASLGKSRAQMVSVTSSAGVTLTLVDPATKNIVWAGRFSYEGLDIRETLGVIGELVRRSMAQFVPIMAPKSS